MIVSTGVLVCVVFVFCVSLTQRSNIATAATHLYLYVYIYIHIYIHICIRDYIIMNEGFLCIWCVYLMCPRPSALDVATSAEPLCVCIYIYIYIYTYTHTYIHLKSLVNIWSPDVAIAAAPPHINKIIVNIELKKYC